MRIKLCITALLLNMGFSSLATAADTPANDDGGGNVVYLDRHHLNCGFDGMQSLRLYRPTTWQIAYNYQCMGVGEGSTNYKQTMANDDGGGNMLYLDRHVVDCQNKPLQFVHLFRPSTTQIAYEYRCGNNSLGNISDHYTPVNADGGGNSIFLDRHDVACPAGKVLSYFHLQRPTTTTIRYHYKCGTKQGISIKAGPIWGNHEAAEKCEPVTANYGGWNGQWLTTVWGEMSVCGTNEGQASANANDANAGPIWDQADAQVKCPVACQYYGGWNGQWTTLVPSTMSVCGCNQNLR